MGFERFLPRKRYAFALLIVGLVLIGLLIFEVALNVLLILFFGHIDRPFCASTDVYCSPYGELGPTPATYFFWGAQIVPVALGSLYLMRALRRSAARLSA